MVHSRKVNGCTHAAVDFLHRLIVILQRTDAHPLAARQPIHLERIKTFAADAAAVAFGAAVPAVYFILAAAGAIHLHTAFQIAKWSGLGLICAYGFVGARLTGAGPVRAIGQTLVVGAIGMGLIVLKSLTH